MMSRHCGTWSLPLTLMAIFPPACSGETQTTVRQTILFRGTVTNLDTGANLLTFCASEAGGLHSGDQTYARYAEVVHFQAAAGARVREDIQWEKRTDRIYGSDPPQRDDAFWCAGGGVSSGPASLLTGWACKTAAPPDPAAIVEDVQPFGVTTDGGLAQGHSLTLRVVHPGIVWTAFEEQCSLMQYHWADPTKIGEATIDPL
jgi:hypothetical protein